MADLPCPQCGSHRSLGSLRKKLREVKVRVASVKRYKPEPVHTHSPATHTHKLGVSVAHKHTATHHFQNTRVDDRAVLAGRITTDKFEDMLCINDAQIETCADCGTFYSPNAKDVGDAIQKQIYETDPLGALAEIGGADDA